MVRMRSDEDGCGWMRTDADGCRQMRMDLDRHGQTRTYPDGPGQTQKVLNRPGQTWGFRGFQAILPDFGTNACGICIGGLESEDIWTFLIPKYYVL